MNCRYAAWLPPTEGSPVAAVGGQNGMRRTELTDRVQITFSIADPLPVLQRLAVAALKDDAIILQKRFLLSQTQIHDPVFRVRDHDFPHASVARAVHHAANLLRRNMPRRKYGIIRLDQRENVEQLRQKITSAVRHADATRFSALAIFVLCVHGRQPDDLRAHAQRSLHRLLIEPAGLPVQNQPAVHIERIVAVNRPVVCVAQRRARDGARSDAP